MYAALWYCAFNALNVSTSGRAAKARLALSSTWCSILERKTKHSSVWVAGHTALLLVAGKAASGRKVCDGFKLFSWATNLKQTGSSEGQRRCSGDVKESSITAIGSVQSYEEGVIWWRQPRGHRPIRVKRLQNEVSAQCLGPWRLFSPREEQVHSKPYRPNPRANKGWHMAAPPPTVNNN